MKYHIITYGCQMNKADSERIASALESKGYKLASDIKEANLIVVNMCSVRQSAVDRVFGLTQKLSKIKTQSSNLKTVLTGCILKKDRRKFEKIFDEIWSNKDYFDLTPKCLNKSLAYVPISNGCNNFCAYCVVPFTRGKLVCRPHQDIIKEIRNLVKHGFKEIWLLGQNVNDYQDKFKIQKSKFKNTSQNSKIINFAKLIKLIDDISENFKFSFTSPHPKNFSDELINILAQCKKYSRYLNLPVQSGDDKILKAMNRPYTVKQYKNLVKKIREKMPDINLSADAIVGFPGETKKQFENTVKLFKAIKFDIAYIAKYSPRPGTAAATIKDNVPLKEKKRREMVLREIIKK